MNKFLLLTKVSFLSGFNVNRKKKNQRGALSAFLITIIVMVLASFGLCSAFFIPQQEGMEIDYEAALLMVCFMAVMLSFTMGLFQMQTVLFKTKDYDMLESMPFSKKAIVGAKITSIYLINLAEDAALVIPAIIYYVGMTHNYLCVLVAIISIFFLSFLPILVSTIIGLCSALITAKSKHANIINLIVNLLFFAAFFAGYMFLLYGDKNNMANTLCNVFVFDWLYKAFNSEYIYLLWFVLFNIAIAIIVVGILIPLYRPINSWTNSNNGHIDYEKIKNKVGKDTNLNKTLLKKEWNMIFRKTNYLLNSTLGGLFFLILGIFFIFGSSMFASGDIKPEDEEQIRMTFAYLVPALGIMMNSIACTASTSISFEKRAGYELLRSYPLDPKDIIKAKVKISIIISTILNLFTSTVLTIILLIKGFREPALILMIYIFPQLASINMTGIGMLCGLKWPKLDFENDQQVIKNSASANLPVLFCMLPSFIVFVLHMVCVILGYELPVLLYVSLGVISIIYIIQICIFYSLLNRKGTNLFNKIINK